MKEMNNFNVNDRECENKTHVIKINWELKTAKD